MSEIISNLVNVLSAVRGDYNDRLKTVPQYEAFLLVETSTQKAFDALRDLLNAGKPSTAGEVLSSLEIAKSKFKQHLHSVAEYRALLAIDKLIGDVSIDAEEQTAAVPDTVVARESETAAQEVAAAQPELPAAVSPPKQAETADSVDTPEISGIQPDPVALVPETVALVAAPPSSITPSSITPSSITPSVTAEVATDHQEPTEGTEISLAAPANAISQPEAAADLSAAHDTEPDALPSALPDLPMEAVEAETVVVPAVSTAKDEAVADAVAENEKEGDATVIASSEHLPSTPYEPAAEKAA